MNTFEMALTEVIAEFSTMRLVVKWRAERT